MWDKFANAVGKIATGSGKIAMDKSFFWLKELINHRKELGMLNNALKIIGIK